MADVGMHGMGEVQRRGAARQVDDLPARGQHVDAVLDQLGVEAAGELARALRACLQQPLHPSDLAVERGVAGSRALRSTGLLVAPVRSHAPLGLFVPPARYRKSVG